MIYLYLLPLYFIVINKILNTSNVYTVVIKLKEKEVGVF